MRRRFRHASWRDLDPLVLDGALALVFVALAQTSVWTGWGDEQGDRVGATLPHVVAALGYTAPLVLRRRAPLPALAVMATAIVCQVLFVTQAAPFIGGYIPILIATYAVAAYRSLPEAAAGGAIAVAGVLVVTLRITELRLAADIGFDVATVGIVWLVGRGMYRRGARADALSDHVRVLELQAREAVVQERARIARELHDVIAHSVSVMGVQAGAAEQVLALDPERAREPLRAIQDGAREAIAELRLLLGVLRSGDDRDGLEPQPGLAQLGALVEDMRRAGLPARLTVEGAPARMSAGVELSAYRIVQEALTNALKHARGADATVTIRHGGAALELEVLDTGGGDGARPVRPGHGLIGMRERVGLYGGTITTGERPGGGYAVRARLPLDGRAA